MSFSPLREANATLEEKATQDGRKISDEEDDVFHIPPKPSLEMLKKWRKATLVLNATRRFRYTVDLKNKEIVSEKSELKNGELVSRFRTVTHALRAIQRFKEAGQRYSEGGPIPEGFGIGPSQLVHLMQNQQIEAFQQRYPGGVKKIAQRLKSDLEDGIEGDGVEKRKEAFGSNKIPPKPGKSFWVFVWESCHDTTLIILMACAVVSFGTEMWSEGPSQGWYDGVSIGAAVLIVIAVTATSDYRQSLQFRDLIDVKQNISIEVVRGGRRCKISVFDVVVGDVVFINMGDQIPADGLLISGRSLTIDESSMTGESIHVFKDTKAPFLMSGCKVTDGYGKMLVTAVGTNTEWGQILLTLTEDNGEETPLQVRLNGAATFIGQIGLAVAVLVFVILFIRFFASDFKNNKKASNAIQRIVNIFAIAVTIVVVAVPEGLPLAVTLTLAYSMRKMMNDNAFVRNLAACETMGSATTICSDKTGTLTLNKMSVTKSWVAGQLMEAEHVKKIPDEVYQTLLIGICQNSSGSVFAPKDGEVEISGSPTESAALAWGVQIGMNFDEIKRVTSVIHVETFNSTKKRAGVAVKVDNGDAHAYWKGAAEMILELSDRWVNPQGSVEVMTQDNAEDLRNQIEGMAAASLRCIAFAYKELDLEYIPVGDDEELRTWEIPYQGLIFVAVIGIKVYHLARKFEKLQRERLSYNSQPNDISPHLVMVVKRQLNDAPPLGPGAQCLDLPGHDPCRPGVRDAVGRCQAAGVKVRMVTGDSVITAKAIAEECGILTKGGTVVEGKVFRTYNQEELDRELPRIDVMARSSPSDKLLLVKALKERGEVVAVTGDGTNDAPALHDADIGLSMGIAGTEIAKESSDIVILDDNFASIVKVVRWGRSVYANIQKFLQFQLTVNVTALVINFTSSITSGNVPLTAVQLLWVNLIMDTLGALALATEAPTDDLMARKPVGRREPLITNVMWRNVIGQALYQVVVLLVLNYDGKKILHLENEDNPTLVKNTIIFNAFVFCQIFNEVNSRHPDKWNIFEGLIRNHLFLGIIISETVLQFLIVQFLKKFASTHTLSWKQWLICVGIGFVSWPLAFLLKLIRVRDEPYLNTRRIRMIWRKKKYTLTKQLSCCSRGMDEEEGSKSNVGEDQLTTIPDTGTSSV